jgi:NADH:ubiquinone oxidoreductase subunit E
MSAHAQLNLPSGAQQNAGAEPERHVLIVCNGEQCRRAGSEGLLGLLLHWHSERHSPPSDVRIGVSRRCIGRCAMAPAMIEDGRVLGRVSLRRLRMELARLSLFQGTC